jgi:hypothetical protein
MTWTELQHEYERERIGVGILELVTKVVGKVVREGYDPQIYGRVVRWEDGIEDVVQEVVVRLLLDEGQLDYIMAVSRDEGDFQRLLQWQIRRFLARRRQRTIIDNLLDRSKPILAEEPFVSGGPDKDRRYHLQHKTAETREATEEEIRKAAIAVSAVAWIRPGRGDRAPVVYTEENLRAVLVTAATNLPCEFGIRELDRIFRIVLTDWLPGVLISSEGVPYEASRLTAEEMVVANDTAGRILKRLSESQGKLLAFKLASVSDGDIAKAFGMSRPTLAERKQLVYGIVRSELEGLSSPMQDAAVQALSLALAPEVNFG